MGKPVGNALDLRQIASPSAPAAGLTSLYSKSDGGLYLRSSTLAEAAVLTSRNQIGGANLVQDSSFENTLNDPNMSGWVNNGGTTAMSKDTTQHLFGTRSMKVVAGQESWGYWAPNGATSGSGGGLVTNPVAIVGQPYVASIYVYSPVAQTLCLTNYTNNGSPIQGPSVSVPANTWTRLICGWTPTGTGGTLNALSVRNPDRVTIISTIYLDAFQLEMGDVATAYAPKTDEILPASITAAMLDTAYAPASGSANYASADDPHLFRDVRAVQTANVSLASATVSVDGVTLVAGDRVLLSGQTAAAENGIYTVGTVTTGNAPLTRDTHFNTAYKVANAGLIEVTEGTVYGGTAWLTTFKTTNTLDTTTQSWYRVVDRSYLPMAALFNRATASQAFAAGTDTYVTGSNIAIPTGRMQIGTIYRAKIFVTKTAAGAAAASAVIRMGTTGTIADANQAAPPFPSAQTAAADTGVIDLECFWYQVAGTTAQFRVVLQVMHNLAATGFLSAASGVATATSGNQNLSTANLQIGVSLAPGASAVWTVTGVEARLENFF